MLADSLRKSILQAAIEGKLTEQRPDEDGDARDLLAEIQKEKARLVKEGKIRRSTPLPPVADDEIPFDIPENWCWVRLGEITNTITDGTHSRPQYVEDGVPFLSVKDINTGSINFSQVKRISSETHEELKKRCFPQKGDMLITKVGTTGIPAIVDCDIEFSLFVSVALMKYSTQHIYPFFLKRTLESPTVQAQVEENTRGVGNQNWVLKDIKNTIIPLPPLAEQRRIVARLEELLPLVGELGKNEKALDVIEREFPAAIRKSLLQAAIEGKLTEQRPDEDGDARDLLAEIQKEKARLVKEGKIRRSTPLPPVTDDEIPFDIPENWCWVRLGELIRVISGVSYNKGDVTNSGLRVLRGGNIQDMKVLLKDDDVFLPQQYNNSDKSIRVGDCLIVASTGSKAVIGKAGYVNKEISNTMIGAFLRICRPYISSLAEYLRCIFSGELYRKAIRDLSQGTNINNVKESYITELVIPLPPLAEQRRIVARLEELLPLVEELGEMEKELSEL